jgi:2',3'-cyclic-nucleotide 2'-phosphodiesterase (5'-nucleotidase family)
MSHHSLVALHWEGDQLVPETELPYETVNYDTEVTILHTNDFHSCIDSFADGAGGLARIATTVRRAQANGPTLMVDAGDSVFGSPTLWSTQGAGSTARLRGAAGYHLAALGNHDLEHGAPGVRELLEGGYRLVASNLEFADADLAKQIAPAYMTSVDGLRIGFTGVTTLDTLALVPRRVLDGVQFIDPYESTVRTVKALEPLVDVVVVLSHLGFDSDELLELMPEGQAPVMMLQNDRGLVGRLKGSKVAAILGGHSHAALAPTPVMAGIAVCNAGAYGRQVGELKLRLAADGIVEVRHSLIDQDAAVPEEAALMEARERERQSFAASVEQNVVLTPPDSVTTESFDRKARQYGLLARALAASPLVSDGSIMLVPRLYMLGELPDADRVRLVDVRIAYPNTETLVEVTLDGAALLRLLELQKQLMSFEAATPLRLHDGEPLQAADVDAGATYTIVTSELQAEGGLRWTLFPDGAASVRSLDLTCANVVWSYLLSGVSADRAVVGAGAGR